MLLAFFLFFASSILAFQHAYLEALIHKAFDPIFGNAFLEKFLSENDFNPDKIDHMDFKKWSRRIPRTYSAWLPKLGQKNYEFILERIILILSSWSDLVAMDERMFRTDVVDECAFKCKSTCDFFYANASGRYRLLQAILNQEFLYLVYKVQEVTNNAHLDQARYFELLNKANEEMERTYVDIKYDQVNYSVYDYEKMSTLAKMLPSKGIDLPGTITSLSIPVQSAAKEAVRIVNSARHNALHLLDANSKDLEEAMIGTCSELRSFSTTKLKEWAKGKSDTIIHGILILNVFAPAVRCIGKSSHSIYTDSSFPVPISIMREIKAVANDMTHDEIMSILKACEEYRQVARLLDDINRPEQRSLKLLKLKEFEKRLTILRSIRLPPDLSDLFNIHVGIMSYAAEFLPSIVHFSNVPVNERARIGMERDYLQKLAYWINGLTKVIPEGKREAHFQLMFRFITVESKCLIPEDQRELVMMTLILMIDGGLRAYYN